MPPLTDDFDRRLNRVDAMQLGESLNRNSDSLSERARRELAAGQMCVTERINVDPGTTETDLVVGWLQARPDTAFEAGSIRQNLLPPRPQPVNVSRGRSFWLTRNENWPIVQIESANWTPPLTFSRLIPWNLREMPTVTDNQGRLWRYNRQTDTVEMIMDPVRNPDRRWRRSETVESPLPASTPPVVTEVPLGRPKRRIILRDDP